MDRSQGSGSSSRYSPQQKTESSELGKYQKQDLKSQSLGHPVRKNKSADKQIPWSRRHTAAMGALSQSPKYVRKLTDEQIKTSIDRSLPTGAEPLQEIQTTLEEVRSQPPELLLRKAHSQLMHFRQVYASKDTYEDHVTLNPTSGKFEKKTLTVNWEDEPATLGRITPLIDILTIPIRVMKEDPERYSELLQETVAGIPLHQWGSYTAIADYYDEDYEEYVEKYRESALQQYKEECGNKPKLQQKKLRQHLAEKKADIELTADKRLASLMLKQEASREKEETYFEDNILESIVEYQLKKTYDNSFIRRGWTLGSVIDDMNELLGEAVAASKVNNESGYSSDSGTETGSASGEWL